jgi:hypothetical protein
MAEVAGSDRRTVEADRLLVGSGRRMAVVAGRDRHTEADSTIQTGVGLRACREESLGMEMAMEMGSGIRAVAGVRLMSR